MAPPLPTGTVSLVFSDIEGSTALLQELGEDKYNQVRSDYQHLLRAAFEAHEGREVDTQGDGLFYVFSRARDAVEAAIAALRRVAAHKWPNGVPVRVRMGIHTGEPLSSQNGYVGIAVHRAARICQVAHGGQILVSHSTYALVEGESSELPDVTLRDLGDYRLKDLPRRERLFQVVVPDLPSDFPPIRSLDSPNNLPRQLTSFVGREREIAEIKSLLAKSPLVTLTGAGGSGKTRLGLEVAAKVLDDFPHGVWRVELGVVLNSSLVPQAVASTLGVREQPGRVILDTILDYLHSKSLLLVLDDADHLLPACAEFIDALLQRCSNLRVLVTTREALKIKGEQIYPVPALQLPPTDRPSTIEQLAQYEAVRLFIDRAAEALPSFGLTEGNAADIVQISHRVDGVPLALELAAARIRALTVAEILSLLNRQFFRLLTSGKRTGLKRHETMWAAIDWSFKLPTQKPEKVLFRRLAVFQAGFTREAVEAVCSGTSVQERDVLDLLSKLLEKALVVADYQGKTLRYRFLEPIREYSREKLLESKESEALHARHRDYFLREVAEAAAHKLRNGGQLEWLDRLESELPNLRAALNWSRADKNILLRFGAALRDFWHMRDHLSEGRIILEAALNESIDSSSYLRSRVLCGAALLMWRQGDHERAKALYSEALALSQKLEDKLGIAAGRYGLGVVALNQGDTQLAKALVGESLSIWTELRDKPGQADAEITLGELARSQGDYEDAAEHYDAAKSIVEETGDDFVLMIVLHNLGQIAVAYDPLQSAEFFRQSLMTANKIGSRINVALAIAGLARVAVVRGRLDRAGRLVGAAEGLLEDTGYVMEPNDRDDFDQTITSVGAQLRDQIFMMYRIEGHSMALDQMIPYALKETG